MNIKSISCVENSKITFKNSVPVASEGLKPTAAQKTALKSAAKTGGWLRKFLIGVLAMGTAAYNLMSGKYEKTGAVDSKDIYNPEHDRMYS